MSSLKLVFYDRPGAGQGNQAHLLKEGLDIPHIISGDLFRYHLQERTPIVIEAAPYVNRGVALPGYPDDGVSNGFIPQTVQQRGRGE